MPKRRLLWQLLASFALAGLGAVALSAWLAVDAVEDGTLETARADLKARARFLIGQLAPAGADDAFKKLARSYDQATGIRVTVLTPDGRVNFDSQAREQELEGPQGRPEIDEARAGKPGEVVRYSRGLDRRVIYLAEPVMRDAQVQTILYVSMPLAATEHTLSLVQRRLLLAAALVALLIIPLAWRASQLIARPLAQLRVAISQLATGQWDARAALPEVQEPAELTEAFNRMADSLQQRIGLLTRHNNEQKAVLASMAEGVLAVDSQERLISLNKASSQLLGLDQNHVQGRRLQEVIRNADLTRFISRALAGQEPIEADVLLHGGRQRVMQARGSALHDVDGRAIGAVVVLNDVTDFRRLEDIRRDFVANVSHELKTPVTSIKGFVETLLDGAMRDPTDAERFLRIIARQADRLHAIIEDLLSLSKIEQNEDADDIALEVAPLASVLESALNACQAGAADREIGVTLQCEAGLSAKINPLLLEQAVVNLLDNAVKYSDPGRQVSVVAKSVDGETTISVADHGVGIAQEHLSRIFERFYRVDRARSRKLGGTGLGLAIVKHIVQAHHGSVTVDSTLGVGTTFTIRLPRA